MTALYAAQAITAALFARERGAGGTHLQMTMLDAVVSFLWADAAGNELLRDADRSRPSSFVQNFKPFRFLDGWGICTPTSDANFAGMCRALGVEGYDDPRIATIVERMQHRELTAGIMERCYASAATMTTAAAIAALEAEQVPCGVVVAPDELASDPHAQAIGLLVDSESPVVGRMRQPRHPAQFDDVRPPLAGPAPALGADTDAVLAELGYARSHRGTARQGRHRLTVTVNVVT